MDNSNFIPEIRDSNSLTIIQGTRIVVASGRDVVPDIGDVSIEGYGFCKGAGADSSGGKEIALLNQENIPYIICRHKGTKEVIVFVGTQREAEMRYIADIFHTERVAGHARARLLEVIRGLFTPA